MQLAEPNKLKITCILYPASIPLTIPLIISFLKLFVRNLKPPNRFILSNKTIALIAALCLLDTTCHDFLGIFPSLNRLMPSREKFIVSTGRWLIKTISLGLGGASPEHETTYVERRGLVEMSVKVINSWTGDSVCQTESARSRVLATRVPREGGEARDVASVACDTSLCLVRAMLQSEPRASGNY